MLIDECIDERLRFLFPGHECQTARFAGFSGLKNGRLLAAAEAAGFDVLVTVDQNLPDQQNLGVRRMAVLILCGLTSRLVDLRPLVPEALAALTTITPGQVARIQSPDTGKTPPGIGSLGHL